MNNLRFDLCIIAAIAKILEFYKGIEVLKTCIRDNSNRQLKRMLIKEIQWILTLLLLGLLL